MLPFVRVFQSITECYRVLQSVTEYHRVGKVEKAKMRLLYKTKVFQLPYGIKKLGGGESFSDLDMFS